MYAWFAELSPVMQATLGTLFTWGMTALGAALVFTTRSVNQKFLDSTLGFAGGVMIAASIWSLIIPALDMAEAGHALPPWLVVAIGFLAGGLFLSAVDKVVPHLHPEMPVASAEGINPQAKRRSTLLVLAITMHNIPEGLAIGVAFGAVAIGSPTATLTGAIALAIGIGLQNLPEGIAVSMPLRKYGMSRSKSFMYGQFSGMVEPIAAIIGAAAILIIEPILPYALSFAAGAMIFVVVEEVIPSSHENGNSDIASMSLMIGFVIMMILDVALG